MPRSSIPLRWTIGPCSLLLLAIGSRGQAPPKVTSQLKNELGMEFVSIAKGEFMMGCSDGDALCNADENPRHRIQITKGFEMGKFEVTQAQWTGLMHDNPSSQQGSNLPVETISKLDAQAFVAKLNELHDGYHYRLPTEAEWEYAARAGENIAGKLDDVAWYAATSDDETHPVGLKKPNAWGLFDMLGNVREWVSDLYSPTYYTQSPAADPSGPSPEQYAGSGLGRGGGPPAGRAGRGPAPPAAEPTLPPNATQQQQLDALRQEVTQLRDEIRQLREQLGGAPPFAFGGPGRGGPQPFGPGPGTPGGGPNQSGFGGPGRGGLQALGSPTAGPAVVGAGGELYDPLDGLPTGLPVVRGGGWDQSAKFQRVSARYTYYGPTLRVSDIGLRVVRVK